MLSFLVLLCYYSGYTQNKTIPEKVKKLVLTNATIINMVSEEARRGSIIIEDKMIASIDYSTEAPTSENSQVIDLEGKYVIPGLIDAHVHLSTMSFNSRKEREVYYEKLLGQMLMGGVTSVRDMAGDARILSELKRASALNEIKAPNIYYSAFMAGPDYYEGNDREGRSVVGWPQKYSPWLQCITPETNLTYAVAQAIGCGATGLKLYASLNAEMIKKIVEEAKKQGIGIWSHSCVMSAKPSDAVNAGVEVISHAEMLKWEQCDSLSNKMFDNYRKYYGKMAFSFPELDSLFIKMREKNIILDATCYHGTVNGLKEAAIFTQKAHEMGVKVAAGTDYFTDPDKKELPFVHDELETLVKNCGFTPYQAIRSATIIAAETFGRHNELGTIEQGKIADLVVLDANPLEEITNTKIISIVIKEGVVYKK